MVSAALPRLMNASDHIPDPVTAVGRIRAVHDAADLASVRVPESGMERWRIGKIASEWYALNPDIRRLWIFAVSDGDPDDARDIHVIVVLAPVCDSDDIGPIWLARSMGWQRHLQRLIGRTVHLDRFDEDTKVRWVGGPGHAHDCLARIEWRDCS